MPKFRKKGSEVSEKNCIPVIAIDGPSSSGKGTVAAALAQRLGFHYLDSGALYRLTALSVIKAGVDPDDEASCQAVARAMKPVFKDGRIYLGQEDVTQAIRAEAVGLCASRVAALPAVRRALTDLQRDARQAPGLVADGRDMASVIFPDAVLKVFLTASPEARAKRRFNQLIAKGISANLSDLTRDLAERDRRDRERKAAPCVPAQGARVLDNSEMDAEQTLELIHQWYQEQCD